MRRWREVHLRSPTGRLVAFILHLASMATAKICPALLYCRQIFNLSHAPGLLLMLLLLSADSARPLLVLVLERGREKRLPSPIGTRTHPDCRNSEFGGTPSFLHATGFCVLLLLIVLIVLVVNVSLQSSEWYILVRISGGESDDGEPPPESSVPGSRVESPDGWPAVVKRDIEHRIPPTHKFSHVVL